MVCLYLDYKKINTMSQAHLPISESRTAAERLMERPEVSVDELTDHDGKARLIYTLESGEQLIFRGRDDLLVPRIDTDRAPLVLTPDEAPHIPLDRGTIPKTHSLEHPLLVATATPLGVIDLAAALRGAAASIDDLQSLRQRIKAREFGPKEYALLDLMAAAVYESDRHSTYGAPNLKGLIDVAKALNGDAASTELLHDKLKQLEKAEHDVTIAELGDLALEKYLVQESSTSPEIIEQAKGLFLVRATDFPPEINPDGTVRLKSASDYTHDIEFSEGGRAFIPRETIHFSINHPVTNHMSGSFGGRGFTIIAPFDKALEANPTPTRIADVDTYFLTGPNETLTLPESTVVSPDTMNDIVQVNGNRVSFKASHYEEADLQKIIKSFQNGDLVHLEHGTASEAYAELALKTRLMQFAEQYAMFSDERNSEVVKFCVQEGELPQWRLAPPLDRSICKEMTFTELAHAIASRQGEIGEPVGLDLPLGTIVSEMVVEKAIIDKGGRLVKGGTHYSSSPELQAQLNELSTMLRTRTGLHANTAEQNAESIALQQLYADEIPYTTVNEALSYKDLPHGVRRSYIANGLLMAYGRPAPVYDDNEGV